MLVTHHCVQLSDDGFMHAIVGLTALNIGLNAHSNTKRSDARNMESNLDEESNRYTHQRYLLKRTRDTR